MLSEAIPPPLVPAARLEEVYRRLFRRYGPQGWWPAQEPFEVMVGAVLTQATSWKNVERAISNLKQGGDLTPQGLRQLPREELARLIYPCLYYNVKASKLKALAGWLGEAWGDSLERLFALDMCRLRDELLSVYGIGEETADSIILYAAGKPIFVIDAYTRRILSRLGLAPEREGYARLQSLFMDNLTPDVPLFNEYHALLVRLGKDVCRKRPLCPACPLEDMCPSGEGPGPGFPPRPGRAGES